MQQDDGLLVFLFCFFILNIFSTPSLSISSAGQPPSRSGQAPPVASPDPVAQRAAAGQRRLGVAGQTALQAVHGPVQQLHPDAPRPGEHAGRDGTAEGGRRRGGACLLPAPVPVRDLHPDVDRRALSQGDALGGRRVQVSDGRREYGVAGGHTHAQSGVQV